MIQMAIEKWEQNKGLLRERLDTALRDEWTSNAARELPSYIKLVEYIVVEILNGGVSVEGDQYKWQENDFWDDQNVQESNFGGWQGTAVYLIAPASGNIDGGYNLLVTIAEYGSCSYCDALQNIISRAESCRENDPETFFEGADWNSLVDGLMALCLHMIQRMKRLCDNAE